MAVKKYVAVRMGVIYDSPGDQQERGRLSVMPQLLAGSARAGCGVGGSKGVKGGK